MSNQFAVNIPHLREARAHIRKKSEHSFRRNLCLFLWLLFLPALSYSFELKGFRSGMTMDEAIENLAPGQIIEKPVDTLEIFFVNGKAKDPEMDQVVLYFCKGLMNGVSYSLITKDAYIAFLDAKLRELGSPKVSVNMDYWGDKAIEHTWVMAEDRIILTLVVELALKDSREIPNWRAEVFFVNKHSCADPAHDLYKAPGTSDLRPSLITGIGELVFPSSITIRNGSGVELRNVEIIGEAGSSTPVDLAPGETTSGKYHLAGVSQKGGRFTPPDGQPVEEWYMVAGIGLSRQIEVTINPNLKIAKQEK